MRESQEELAARLDEAKTKVQVGARYEHYKKLLYKVLHLALREEDCEPCVVYQTEYGEHIIYIRTVQNWLETVDVDGQKVPRFTKL